MSRGREKHKMTIFSSISSGWALGSCLLPWMRVTGTAQQWEPKPLAGHRQAKRTEGSGKKEWGLPRYMFNYVIKLGIKFCPCVRTALQEQPAWHHSRVFWVWICEQITRTCNPKLSYLKYFGSMQMPEMYISVWAAESKARAEERKGNTRNLCMTKFLHEDGICRLK